MGGVERHRELDMNNAMKLHFENNDKDFIDRAKERVARNKREDIVGGHRRYGDNEDALFIQPEGNASKMPSDIEEKLRIKYDHCSQQDLIEFLEDIKNRALVLKDNMTV